MQLLTKVCKCCDVEKELSTFRFKRESKRPNGYYLSICKSCEKIQFRKYQKQNLDKFREYNKQAYVKKNGPITRNMHHTEASRAQWSRDKSNRRCTRAKQARRMDEFTLFVYKEAQELRKLRNTLTRIEWHVDHIIPLKGDNVCGLHVWNNFAVIPKIDNLRKGNRIAFSTEWCSPV